MLILMMWIGRGSLGGGTFLYRSMRSAVWAASDSWLAAGDASGASSHKFSSGSFTEGRIAGKGMVAFAVDNNEMPEIDEEEIDTLGGLVAMIAGHLPARGEVVLHPDGPEFEIVVGSVEFHDFVLVQLRIMGELDDFMS